MAINRINTRAAFKSYCLRKLGEPVTQINVAPTQVDDSVDDALDMFWEYHADGSTQHFFKHEITQTDIDNGFFQLPVNVLSVIRLLSLGGCGGMKGIANMAHLQYQSFFSDMIS